MARIRSIKPEFWTDSKMVALDPSTRLFFIGLWNFADDYGVLEDDPDSLNLRIMPADDFDAHAAVDELVDKGRLARRFSPSGAAVLVIAHFSEHQKIDKRAAGKWGDPAEWPKSPPIPTSPPESPPIPPLEGKGREGKGKENRVSSNGIDASTALVPIEASPSATRGDVEVVFAAWQDATGKSKARLDEKRRRYITQALKNYPADDLVDAVRGWRHFPHNRGENERRTTYNDLELILRDSAHIERFRDAERGSARPPPIGVTTSTRNLDAWREATEREDP